MLGRAIQRTWSAQHEVLAYSHAQLDVTSPTAVQAVMHATRPEVVLHLAAWTDVDACEKQHDEALCQNVLGTELIAAACRRHDSELIYISTAAVFGGQSDRAYTEYDEPQPGNWYAHTKWLGEQAVAQLTDRFYIVRAGWLFGGWPDDHKFVGKLLQQARSADRILAVDDKYGSPTYTADLAESLLLLLELGLPGTYHVVNTGEPATRYEVACRVVEFAGLNCEVEPIGSERFALAAPRPTMEAVRNFRLELMGQTWMRSWQAALRAYITQIMAA